MKTTVMLGTTKVECVDLFTLSKWLGKRSRTVREWEEKGIIKQPILRMPDIKLADGRVRKGRRLYSKELAHKIVIASGGIQKGIKVSDEIKMEIYRAFEEEKNMVLRCTGKTV
jgi:hypothetical protein